MSKNYTIQLVLIIRLSFTQLFIKIFHPVIMVPMKKRTLPPFSAMVGGLVGWLDAIMALGGEEGVRSTISVHIFPSMKNATYQKNRYCSLFLSSYKDIILHILPMKKIKEEKWLFNENKPEIRKKMRMIARHITD